jgi:hypothetical protein
VFRHRFEKSRKDKPLGDFVLWGEWELGLWFRRMQIVGKKNFHILSEWKNNHVYMYVIGINLLWCKMWITFDKGGMSLEIRKLMDENNEI